MPSKPPRGSSVVSRLLPFTFLCTIGPSVTAATALLIVRSLMCQFDYVRHGGDDMPSGEYCRRPRVGALTASVMTGLAVMDGIVSFLSTSYVQRLADKYGRRPLLYTLPAVATISTISMMVAYTAKNPNLAWVLLAMNGIFVSASTKAIFVPTLSVTDVANEQQRTRFFSRLEAVSLLGPGIGYVMSALVSRYTSITLLPYCIALASQLLAALYAAAAIPETVHKADEDDKTDSDAESEAGDNGGLREVVEETMEAVVEPVKPLRLLMPRRNEETGRIEWRLFLVTVSLLITTIGTVFIATASLLYLSDKFNFQPEENGWVLAYLTFSRFVYLILIFPFIQRGGRKLYHWYQAKRSSVAPHERSRLLQRESFRQREATNETNHFDIILCFVSVCFDAVALILVSLSRTPKQALISFAFLALGSGDNPTFKSVFTSLVPPEKDSQALAALDMVWNAARLLSPLLLGGLYALLVEIGKPEMLFLVAGACCAVGAVLLAPLVFVGRDAPR
ncbi:major facilitator superfamily domain-containing protein [Papiliotrema laurentii]|uniref:Major facilitator superfamily domain-containing protein n=1 Tax=Papiliotrema laurentii TaxID=5418 RepID=A0AAD9CSH8_PAPLA|nr:major facilitator superfamily domain-containing protein [Papiliotrema laurentii]